MPRGRTAHRVASRWAGFGIGDGMRPARFFGRREASQSMSGIASTSEKSSRSQKKFEPVHDGRCAERTIFTLF
jgi:hypothetical protein